MDREGEAAAPLDGVSSTQARFECTDSLLSEAVVRGFESGYSLADSLTLTLWEARRSAPFWRRRSLRSGTPGVQPFSRRMPSCFRSRTR